MRKIYIVTLTSEERATLRELISSGKAAARKISHARILLKADSSEPSQGWNDAAIGQAWQVIRNNAKAKVNWRFTTKDARIKLKRLYPSIEV